VLKNWLIRALSVALSSNSTSITTQILESTAWSVDQAERMAREVLEGEAALTTTDESRNRLRRLLSLNSTMSGSGHPNNNEPETSKKTQSVGRRNPVRDRIGISQGACHAT
jgi:hypothetical protein